MGESVNITRLAFAQISPLARLVPFATTASTQTVHYAVRPLVVKACAGALLLVTFPLTLAAREGPPHERAVGEDLPLPPPRPSPAAGPPTNRPGCLDRSDYEMAAGSAYMWDG